MGRHTKYRSDLERLLVHILQHCMRPDGTVPHYSILQSGLRPAMHSEEVREILKEAKIPQHKREHSRGTFYRVEDILAALEREQERLQVVKVNEDGSLETQHSFADRFERAWERYTEGNASTSTPSVGGENAGESTRGVAK